LADGGNHQGVAARALPFKYLTLTGLLDRVKILTADPFLRSCCGPPAGSAEFWLAAAYRPMLAGMHGVIIPKDRTVKITPAVRKVAGRCR